LSGKPDVPYSEIVTYLNQKANRNFKPNTASTVRFINGRWGDGYRLPDFKAVIDRIVKAWSLDTVDSEKEADFSNQKSCNLRGGARITSTKRAIGYVRVSTICQ